MRPTRPRPRATTPCCSSTRPPRRPGRATPREPALAVSTYVALLYSITLDRERRLKNADWLRVLEGLGLERPRTFLATGNAVFETARTSIPKLETQLEEAFEQAFGRRIDTIV